MMKMMFALLGALMALSQVSAKSVFIPNAFTTVAAYANGYSDTRQYNGSDNFVVFWGPKVGTDPTNPPDSVSNLAFNPGAICDTLQKSYDKFITEMGFCSDDLSKNLGKYKIIIVINDTWEGNGAPTGWAFGGQYEGVIGAMWVHPGAVADGLVISHEFAHALQGQIGIQENTVGGGYGGGYDHAGFFWECHANFMRCMAYPIMAEDDMPRWLATRMYHWSSTRHHYAAYHLLFTMTDVYGYDMVNRLWQESLNGEHPISTMKRLNSWSQSDYNDFAYENAKREVIFDWTTNNWGTIMRAKRNFFRASEPFNLWREYTMLDQIDADKNSYVVPEEWSPQDYGVNIIPLHSTCDLNSVVKVKFKGHTEANSYAGWRYGFVAESADGTSARYSEVYSDNEGEIAFSVEDNEKVYLVVMGAPTTQTDYVWEAGWPKIYRNPYEVAFENCVPEGYQDGFRADIKAKYAGAPHSNGGGWVSSNSSVDASVYVGPNALVLESSKITGNVQIKDNAWVQSFTVSGNTEISENAHVVGNWWEVSSNLVSDNAVVKGAAVLNSTDATGSAVVKGNSLSWGGTISGTAVVGGDAELVDVSSGVYYQTPHSNNGRTAGDGLGETATGNIDINSTYSTFTELYVDDTIGCGVLTAVVDFTPINSDLLKVYPNPAKMDEQLAVTFDSSKGEKVVIYSRCGVELRSMTPVNSSIKINTASLGLIKSGICYAVLYSGETVKAVTPFTIIK